MQKETREKILEDYKKVSNNLIKILSGEPNFFVKSENYINPIIISEEVSFKDLRGELEYLKEIRDCLEEILTHEITYITIPNAPDYLKEFID